ncbi:MAG: relaxase/mobilization nuclease domain-containing protein [Rikenellaceae bacterium]
MIAKNIKSQSFGGSVGYVMSRRCEREQSSLLELPSREEENERSEVKKDAEVLKAEGVMAMSKEDMITSFELQRSVRPEIKSPVGHIPISFAPEDRERMTNEFMVKLAEEYMENMGIRETQYIIVRHHDGDNEHVHIIYNRIDNRGKLITDKNDYNRNIATCKRLKDKYNLTYGANKFRVKREKLRGSERVKHDIYHAVREEIVYCRTISDLRERLNNRGVEMQYKFRRGSMEVQGMTFTKDGCTFKGSQIDRNFSYNGMQIMFKAIDIEWKKIDEKNRQAQQKKASQPQRPSHNFRYDIPDKIGDVPLTEQQRIALDSGESVCFKDRTDSQGEKFDVYAIWSTQENQLNFFYEDPCKFGSQQEMQQEQEQSQSYTHEQQQSGSFAGGGLGLFDLPGGNGTDIDDIENEQMARNLKPKKKRGRGI